MKLPEYEGSGRGVYGGLAEIVATILEAAIAQVPNLHAQQIQHRAKDVSSLSRKLQRAGAGLDDEIEPHAKDLAGARLIFYTNSDVDRFQASGLLIDNFEIDWDRTRFHHPTSDDPEPSELFVSNNYVVRLKAERAGLPEYARFAGLWCEVQVQTTLNHAWAEMAHDTIYKKPDLAGFGGNLMQGIEARMKAIMRDYLAPAGYAFQKVLSDFERLSRGQALFERDLALAVDDAADINELHETLEKFVSSVLPHFDDYEAAAGDIIAAAVNAVKRARTLPVKAIETPFGNLDGKTAEDVAEITASIVRGLRFLDIGHAFETVCDLFLTAELPEERTCWVRLAGKLAEHNLDVWRQGGPVVQQLLIDQIVQLSGPEKLALKPVVLAVVVPSLSPELSGTTSNLDTLTIHRGSVTASDVLRQMRANALEILFAYDAVADSDAERSELIRAFDAGMAMPHLGPRSDPELAAIIYRNAAEIIQHFVSRVGQWSYELRQSVEHDLLWMHRHHGDAPPADQTNAAAEEARRDMVEAILAFRDVTNADDGFTTYKLLVGFESVFPPAWDDPDFDYQDEEAYRKAQIVELISSIDGSNADHWLVVIRRCAATESNDLATFPMFGHFLESLAAEKPEIIIGYLAELDARLANFLTPMLRGLARSDRWAETVDILRGWVANRQFLSDVAWAFGSIEALDLIMFDEVVTISVTADDKPAVSSSINAISRRTTPATAAQLKPAFLRAVTYMAERNEPHWVNVWRQWSDAPSMMVALSPEETTEVLDTLVAYPRMAHPLERLLAEVAVLRPQLVIDYFGKRMVQHFARDYGRDYQDIPYDLHSLKEALAGSEGLLVPAVRRWFDINPDLFSYHGGKLIEVVFPQFSAGLEAELRAFLGTDSAADTKFVVEVLRAYSGEAFLQPLCKDIVASVEPDDPLLSGVEIALEPSGVTSGEFGRVNRLKAHHASIMAWTTDERQSVRTFAEGYAHQLENQIRAEQRRSEEAIALRRLDWNLPLSGADSNDEEESEA